MAKIAKRASQEMNRDNAIQHGVSWCPVKEWSNLLSNFVGNLRKYAMRRQEKGKGCLLWQLPYGRHSVQDEDSDSFDGDAKQPSECRVTIP